MNSEIAKHQRDAMMMHVAESTVYDGLARVFELDMEAGSDLSFGMIGQIAAHVAAAAALSGDAAAMNLTKSRLAGVRDDLDSLITSLDDLSREAK